MTLMDPGAQVENLTAKILDCYTQAEGRPGMMAQVLAPPLGSRGQYHPPRRSGCSLNRTQEGLVLEHIFAV